MYITTTIGCTITTRNSLATKDFSKTIWNDILHKWYKVIKQHLRQTLNFTCWASIISFAITRIFNLFGLIRLLICLNSAGMQNATIIMMRYLIQIIVNFKKYLTDKCESNVWLFFINHTIVKRWIHLYKCTLLGNIQSTYIIALKVIEWHNTF